MARDQRADAADEGRDQRGDIVARAQQRLAQFREGRYQPFLDHRLLQLRLVAEIVVQQRRGHRRFGGDRAQRGRGDALADVARDGRVEQARAQVGGIAGGTSGAAEALVPTPELEQIGVPAVWAEGITGKGVIVANVDTGVNGDDDTMEDSWRGLYAGSDASWYAPVALTVFPEDDGSDVGHGTAVMGILAGGEETFGVAFEATWIAGDLFEQNEGFVSTAIKIFEWLTDPDGDPSTTTDVPDVVNNSWGIDTNRDDQGHLQCDSIFDEAIDAMEAAGSIVINTAGNEGEDGVTAPASRAESEVNAFAVGAVDDQNEILDFSGRGPSACGGSFSTKPEIVAPGFLMTSRSRFNATIGTFTGTSFSTPLIAGVASLMRAKDPTITPEEAKTILIETAVDLGPGGDDNTFGHGLVDADVALARGGSGWKRAGWTPLHYAAGMGFSTLVQPLLERGADPSRPDEDGKTPLDVAIDANHSGIADVLRSRGVR